MENDNVGVEETPLVKDIEAFMGRFVVFANEDQALVLAVWVLHTWLFEAAHTTPYLYVHGAMQSGKTRLLDVMGIICRNFKRADDMTPPVMFKLIERERPTLGLDEADTVWSGSRNEAKRRLLNTGYKFGGSAWREQARELVEFSTFCPKILAGINNGFMPRTVLDRCIPIELKRKGKGDKTDRFNEYHVNKSVEVEALFTRIEEFKQENMVDVTAQFPEPMRALSDRQNEIAEPLLAIAAVMGIERDLRVSLQRLFNAVGTQKSPQQVILGRIRDAFGDEDRMHTDELCLALGPSYNGRQLALWLEPFSIAPTDIRIGRNVKKGYMREQFKGVWDTYLDPVGLRLVEVEDEKEAVA